MNQTFIEAQAHLLIQDRIDTTQRRQSVHERRRYHRLRIVRRR